MIRLCSSSKTRAEILREYKVQFIQSSVDFDEDSLNYKKPEAFVYYASLGKLKVAKRKYGLNYPILSADTVVTSNSKILRKAKNIEEARESLLLQSGSSVSIITTVHFESQERYFIDTSVTKYNFRKFDKGDLEDYLNSNEWRGKAGSCMVEGFCKKYIKTVSGLESTAKGLQIELILPWI
jgi:septum formation protein